jgi:hypothetical protein
MGDSLKNLADEAMQLEYNVSKLYMIFRDTFEEDAEFWWQLVIEENNHAALIKSGMDYFNTDDLFPREILPPVIDGLIEASQEIEAMLGEYENNPPSREEAFNIALAIEQSAGEIHFQNAMSKSTDSEMLKLFQKLNQDDKDHCQRIRTYMKQQRIKVLA